MRKRDKLKRYGTIEDAVNLLRNSRKILVLSGAGISTSSFSPWCVLLFTDVAFMQACRAEYPTFAHEMDYTRC